MRAPTASHRTVGPTTTSSGLQPEGPLLRVLGLMEGLRIRRHVRMGQCFTVARSASSPVHTDGCSGERIRRMGENGCKSLAAAVCGFVAGAIVVKLLEHDHQGCCGCGHGYRHGRGHGECCCPGECCCCGDGWEMEEDCGCAPGCGCGCAADKAESEEEATSTG